MSIAVSTVLGAIAVIGIWFISRATTTREAVLRGLPAFAILYTASVILVWADFGWVAGAWTGLLSATGLVGIAVSLLGIPRQDIAFDRLRGKRNAIAVGEVFCFRLRGGMYHFGVVQKGPVQPYGWATQFVVHMLDLPRQEPTAPSYDELIGAELLLPPLLVSRDYWRWYGFFRHVGTAEPWAAGLKHGFRDSEGAVRDEDGRVLDGRADLVGLWGWESAEELGCRLEAATRTRRASR